MVHICTCIDIIHDWFVIPANITYQGQSMAIWLQKSSIKKKKKKKSPNKCLSLKLKIPLGFTELYIKTPTDDFTLFKSSRIQKNFVNKLSKTMNATNSATIAKSTAPIALDVGLKSGLIDNFRSVDDRALIPTVISLFLCCMIASNVWLVDLRTPKPPQQLKRFC